MPQEALQLAEWSLVPDILKILRPDFPDSLPSCRYLEFYESCKTATNAILLTPGGKVNEYGTFVVYSYGHNIGTFYSLNPDYKELKSLLKSKVIPWGKNPFFGPTNKKFQPALDEIYDEGNMKEKYPQFPFIGHTYLMDLKEAEKITYSCPPEVFLGPVKEEQGEFITSFWPNRMEDSDYVTKSMIKENGGVGLYLKESNELIAWCLLWAHTGPGLLFVSDQHKRKGYGMLVVKAISKSLAERRIEPLCFIKEGNTASEELFTKVGYKKLFGIRWTGAGP